MTAMCTYGLPRRSFTMPHYAPDQTVRELGIRPGDRVIDIGAGDRPFPRANVVTEAFLHDGSQRSGGQIRTDREYVECPMEKMPFADNEFDFAYCNHVLEHAADPEAACREIMRIAKRGYVETPAYWAEHVAGHPFHPWLLSWEDGTLVFRRKPYRQATAFDIALNGVVHRYWRQDRRAFVGDWQTTHRNQWTLQILWDGDGFPFRVQPSVPVEELPSKLYPDDEILVSRTGERLPPNNAYGQVYPTLFEEDLLARLDVVPTARILEVTAKEPRLRAAETHHVLDVEHPTLPFPDQSFDVVHCVDSLHEVADPRLLCEELMRVAGRGFLEVPAGWTWLLMGGARTRWLASDEGGVLRLRRRRFLDSPFCNVLAGEYAAEPDLRQRFDVTFRNVTHVQLPWVGRFDYQVDPTGDEFDYAVPAQAALAHAVNALRNRQVGASLDSVIEDYEQALALDPSNVAVKQELELTRQALASGTSIGWLDLPQIPPLAAGGALHTSVLVRNAGTTTWRSAGSGQVQLSYHWADMDGTAIVVDGGRSSLPRDARPGDIVRVPLALTAPAAPGSYLLFLDFAEAGGGWLGERGAYRAQQVVQVQ